MPSLFPRSPEDNFELSTVCLKPRVKTKRFGHDKETLIAHIRLFQQITSNEKFPNGPEYRFVEFPAVYLFGYKCPEMPKIIEAKSMLRNSRNQTGGYNTKDGLRRHVLGHKISKNGIEVDKSKVDVIAKLPHRTTIKGVRSFLGHAAFETLKKKLTEAPILITPDWDLPLELMCDASDFAKGAVLGQRHEKTLSGLYDMLVTNE
ncbi:reverse transcriptase domain-containing protein [Tanacetum coccineum]|uniref:Reverse transcriptase domain-containing protein n=1 Tax=Tanacetum coccineum TaxID=301880 RepID=A0ABQ5B388_9ASTR